MAQHHRNAAHQQLLAQLHNCAITCLIIVAAGSSAAMAASGSSFDEQFEVSWAPSNVRFVGSGGQQELQLVLDETTGCGFASKNEYMFGNIDMQIKLVPGDSAGTVTAYYLSSETSNHDELDFEFLGNSSGEPYVLQTNVFSSGVGGREQRIYLWFDPTADFHTYSVSWSRQRVLFLVDGVAIRVFANNEAAGVPFLRSQPLRVFSSLWNGDSWATRGGAVKIDWAHAPFVATYSNFKADACVVNSSSSNGGSSQSSSGSSCPLADSPNSLESVGGGSAKLQWVKSNYMIYDYCTDSSRYPTPPPECSREF